MSFGLLYLTKNCYIFEREVDTFEDVKQQHEDKCQELEDKLISEQQDLGESDAGGPQGLLAKTASQIKVIYIRSAFIQFFSNYSCFMIEIMYL